MHRLIHFFLLVLYIGTFCSALNAEVEEPDPEKLAREGKVFVEPSYVEVNRSATEYKLMPYGKRRGRWGINAGLGYSMYQPTNFESEFAAELYGEIYGRPTAGMIEAAFSVKRNLSGFSVGLEAGVGSFRNDNTDDAYVGSVLQLISGRIGGALFLDTLFSDDPLFVPYATGGGYIMFWRENLSNSVSGGTTQIAPYVTGGIAMELDWLDPRAARVGYEQSGVMRSYFYVEAQKYFTSLNKKDPDFSNAVSAAAGVRCEF